jgi:hypothetical protein
MFTLFRYGLIPVVLFCIVVITGGVHTVSTNSLRKSSWPQTVVTVVQSQDFNQALAEFRGTQNAFPDPYGAVRYVIGGKTYSWQGRGRDIGLTAMTPGDNIKLHYNPENPQEINTLVLLGGFTGAMLVAAALAFVVFYVWFFWVRRFLRRLGSHDSSGDAPESFVERANERLSSEIERSRSTSAVPQPVAINARPAEKSFGQRVTFGKR